MVPVVTIGVKAMPETEKGEVDAPEMQRKAGQARRGREPAIDGGLMPLWT